MDIHKLLEILACPVCHSGLEYVEAPQKRGFLCPKCSVVYPIEDDIPIMLDNAAIPFADWQKGEDK